MEILMGLFMVAIIGAAVLAFRREWRIKAWEWVDGAVRGAEGWPALVLLGGFLSTLALLTLRDTGWALVMLAGTIGALAVAAWVHQFVTLMSMADDAFPGRHDKLVWVALMLLLPPAGMLAFRGYQRAHLAAAPKGRTAVSDLL